MPLRFAYGRRRFDAPWWAVLLALTGTALFVALGRWQWHRAAYKQALIERFATAGQAIVPASGPMLPGLERYTRVRVAGHYDASRQFLLDNLSRDAVAGYEVLTPFQLEDGSWLLVNRGWLPLPGERRDILPDVSLPAGEQAPRQLVGRLDALPVTGISAGISPPEPGAGWPKRTSFPTMAQLSAALAAPLPRWQLLLAADQADGYRRDWQPTVAGFGPERHLAYAIQWWGLAALSLIVLLVVNSRKSTDEG